MKTLGQNIRELRDKKDLSLREFARKLGDISPAHVSDIELGRRFPSPELLAKMAKLLEEPLEELQKYDQRAPIEDIKRMVGSNPAYGFAFRKLVEKQVSPEEILKLIEKAQRDKDKR